jgi:hypothetical protein
VDASIYQPLHEVIALFTGIGWRVAHFCFVTEQARETRSDALERLRLRTLSTFAYFTPEELERGFRQFEEAVAADPGAPVPASQASLLTLERC